MKRLIRRLFMFLLTGTLLAGRGGTASTRISGPESLSDESEGEEGAMYLFLLLLGRPVPSKPDELSETAYGISVLLTELFESTNYVYGQQESIIILH